MANTTYGKAVLVTGGAGYIGSWVTRQLLEAGFHVTVYDALLYGGKSLVGVLGHPRLRFIKGDVRDQQHLREAMHGVTDVVHLAAIVGEAACNKAPEDARAINCTGTQQVVHAAREQGVRRLIFFSTCSSYGVQETTQVAHEETQLNPVSLYAETKIDAERFLRDTVRDGDLCYTIFRPATVHGPSARMRFDLIVNHLTRDACLDRKVAIKGADMWRPLMWVGDAGRAIVATVHAEERVIRNQVFTLGGTDANYRKREIGEILKARLPDLDLTCSASDADVRSYRVDFSKIRTRLGFTLSKPLDAAIGDILQLLETGIVEDSHSVEFQNH